VADHAALRPHATRAGAALGGALLGLAIVFPATAAFASGEPAPSGAAPAIAAVTTPVPDRPIDPPVEAAETPSTSTPTTSSTSTTSTSTSTTTTTLAGPPITSGLIPPLVEDDRAAEVGDAATTSREQPRVRARVESSSGPTLPLTGDSSFAVLAAGLGALAIGGAAVWWGSRRSVRADPADAGSPPARG
jgi:LPXTG-motif cell wall-anchored protein